MILPEEFYRNPLNLTSGANLHWEEVERIVRGDCVNSDILCLNFPKRLGGFFGTLLDRLSKEGLMTEGNEPYADDYYLTTIEGITINVPNSQDHHGRNTTSTKTYLPRIPLKNR